MGFFRPVFASATMLALAPLAATVAPTPVQAAPANDQLAEVQAFLKGVKTMTADFTQTDRNGKVLTGQLTLKRPGKVRFQYEKGVPLLIVANGSSLFFIDYQVRQVQRWPIGNSPLGVLLDPNKDIAGIAKIVPTGNPQVISVEAHDPKHPEYGRINLVLARTPGAPGGLTLQGWVALDSQNNRTTIRLSDQRYNGAVSDGTFRWSDPRRNSGGKH